MINDSVWEGIQGFLDHYVGLRPDDSVLIAYTPDSREPAAWVTVAVKQRGNSIENVWMMPIRDAHFNERLKCALVPLAKLEGRLVVLTFERDTMSHDAVFREALSVYDNDRCLVFRAISTSAALFSHALRPLPQELNALNTSALEYFMPAKKLHIETKGGSSLDVVLDNDAHRWVSNRGIWRPGRYVILPAGEVATFPASINGKFVADFAFNLNAITDRDTRLNDHPVTVWMKDGRAVDFHCDSIEIARFLEQCFKTLCAYNVGELGFGTNFHVNEPIAMNSHINERRPGVHLGFGQHNQDPDVVPYRCDLHLDLIARGALVWVDDASDPVDLEKLTPSLGSHPARFRDEDVFSPKLDLEDLEVEDCCGVLAGGELRIFQLDKEIDCR